MIKVTNKVKRTIGLPSGQTLFSGESVEVEKLDESHPVVKSWLNEGVITKESTKTRKTTAKGGGE